MDKEVRSSFNSFLKDPSDGNNVTALTNWYQKKWFVDSNLDGFPPRSFRTFIAKNSDFTGNVSDFMNTFFSSKGEVEQTTGDELTQVQAAVSGAVTRDLAKLNTKQDILNYTGPEGITDMSPHADIISSAIKARLDELGITSPADTILKPAQKVVEEAVNIGVIKPAQKVVGVVKGLGVREANRQDREKKAQVKQDYFFDELSSIMDIDSIRKEIKEKGLNEVQAIKFIIETFVKPNNKEFVAIVKGGEDVINVEPYSSDDTIETRHAFASLGKRLYDSLADTSEEKKK